MLSAGLDFSAGFADPSGLTVNGSAAITGSSLQLSGGAAASAWSTDLHDITQFTTEFKFQSVGAPGTFTFTLQSNSNTAPGAGLDRTVDFTFNLPRAVTEPFINGRAFNPSDPDDSPDCPLPLNFNNGDTYDVTLSYPVDNPQYGTGVHQEITDLNTGATSAIAFRPIDIPALLGGGAAYVGFAGASGSQKILSWTFTSPSIGATPFAPDYLQVASYENKNVLNWTDNSTNEDGFIIQRSVNGSSDSDFSDLATVPANVTTYTDSGLATNTFDRYRVRAFNGAGSSIESNTALGVTRVPPPAPSNATAVAVSANEVDLTWQNNGTSDSRIYRRAGGTGDFTLIGLVESNTTAFADTSAPSGTLLEYRISSILWEGDYSHDGESGFASASVTTPPAGVDVFGPAVTLNGSAHPAGSSVQLTDNQAGAEIGSAFSSKLQDVTHFTTQFSFQISNPSAGGFTFAMQDFSPTALGQVPSGLGYSDGHPGGYYTAAIQFYLGAPSGGGGGATGVLANGDFPEPDNSIDLASAGIDLRSGHVFNVTLNYNPHGGNIATADDILTETIVDATTGATFNHTYWDHLFFGGLDYVGFTASKPATSQQGVNILSWSYTTGASPSPVDFIKPGPAATHISLSATGIYGGTATLTSLLTGSNGPIGNAPVVFTNSAGAVVGTVVTDASGVATLSGVSIAGFDVGTHPDAFTASFAGDANDAPATASGTLTVTDENLQGLVWVDFNNDGNVDFGESGIDGVGVTLTGTDDLGQAVSVPTQTANGGIYTFSHIRPGTYTITEGAVPSGYVEGKDTVGTLGGDGSVQDVFSNVLVGVDQNGVNYNFGEQPAAGSSVARGQAATMGFWQNRNGQALIASFASIGPWLAATMPQTFGDLAGASPQHVANLYQQQFMLKDKLDAQVMATALNVFATNQSLGGSAAAAYGFSVSVYGLGDSTWNVGSDGAAFGVADNSTLTVMQILQDWDNQANKTSASLRRLALDVFGGINSKGGI